MPRPHDVKSFLDLLQESKLLSTDEFRAVVDQCNLEDAATPKQAAQTLVTEKILTRYQGERLLSGRTRGFYIHGYKVLEIIGFGGMGSLYLAEETDTAAPVALKVLNDKCRNDAGMLTRLKLEATAGTRIKHPHVVQTINYDDTGAICYIAMEFVKGISLLELVLLNQKSLPASQACDVIYQAALGLEDAHQAGIVHRDLKPENLIIDSKGFVKILDFGLALLQDNPEAEFSLAMIFGHGCVGTPEYIAPEQTRDGQSIDSRADVYSLGCTMYFLLSGKLPFSKGTTAQKIQAHREQSPQPLAEIVPKLSQEVITIVEKMMAKKPEDRFQSMAEVAAALKPLAKRKPVEFRFNKVVSQRVREAKSRNRIAQSSVLRPQLSSQIASASRVAEMAREKMEGIERLTRGESELSKSGILRHAIPAKSTNVMAQQATSALNDTIPPAELVSLDDQQRFPLLQKRLVLGRNASCHLQLDRSGVSGEHCELRLENTGWIVTDLNSKNGIEVDGIRVKEQLLFPGNILTIAETYRFQLTDKNQSPSKGKYKNALIAASVLVGIGLIAGIGYWLLS